MLRLIIILLVALWPGLAHAADWLVDRVRGDAFYRYEGDWRPVERGQALSGGVFIKTGAIGRVDIVRGQDNVSLGAATEVQILDSGAALMTTVLQVSGIVTADVEKQNVQHFSVQTSFLAAVVKGTRFTVSASATGSEVDVSRGVVQVQDNANGLVANVRPGQDARVTEELPLEVAGPGPKAIFTQQGEPVNADAVLAAESQAPDSHDRGGDERHGNPNQRNGNGERGPGNGNQGGGNPHGPGNHGNGNGNGKDNPADGNAHRHGGSGDSGQRNEGSGHASGPGNPGPGGESNRGNQDSPGRPDSGHSGGPGNADEGRRNSHDHDDDDDDHDGGHGNKDSRGHGSRGGDDD